MLSDACPVNDYKILKKNKSHLNDRPNTEGAKVAKCLAN